jgi:LuxR family maltose regulon positive regulatory protein
VTGDLLQTKLLAPPLRSNYIPRDRLIARLDSGREAKLILVSAAAGYGKTTLVTAWLQHWPIKSTWLSLDEHDNDPRRFLAYLLAALQQIEPGIGKTVEAILQFPQPPPPETLLTTLVNDIASASTPFLLILDDYHVIQAPPIHHQLNFLVEHLPPLMHLAILTREDPPLPLARLLARGQMIEVRQQDLRFTLDECADFLNQVIELKLRPADIVALEHRTEGWIAGLQLAALSMRGRDDLAGFIDAFTGSSHYVLDYLIEEVFQQQPADVQDFLLKTSILDRLTGPLCDLVASRTGSRDLLERLEHTNLFTLPLDPACTWYRYHNLFAELLHQRLHVTAPSSEPELHRLASQWFAAEKLLPEAIQHALAAGDWDQAADWITTASVAMLSRGELATLLGWIKALPEEQIRRRPQLCRDYGWALTLAGQLDAAAPYLDCAERAMQGDVEHLGQVIVAQAYLARTRGNYPQAIALSKKALGLIRDADVLHRGLVTFTLGFAYFNAGQMAEAELALQEACQANRLSGNAFARLTCMGLLSVIQKNQGRLHRAAEFCRQALQDTPGSPMAAQVQEFLADILYEWNDLEGVREHLEQGLKNSLYLGNRMIQLEICRAMIRLGVASGNATEAQQALRQLQQLSYEVDSPVALRLAAGTQAEFALAQGDIPSAGDWTRQAAEGIDPAALGVQYRLMQARLLLAQDQPAQAAEMLEGLYETVSQAGLASAMIDIRALQALAATSPVDALHFLKEALVIARPEGFIRTFVDKGGSMKALLERLKAQGGELKPYILALLGAFGEKRPTAKAQPLVEPMSERELEILRLLAQGLSNRQIAERLVISVGTTKSHVHHILEKIGSGSRMGAVTRAREQGLI